MTNAPIYTPQLSDRPTTQTKLRNYETPESKGAQVGQAMQGLGESVLKVRDVLELKQQLEDDALTRRAQETFRSTQREALYGEDGYLRKTGTNALGQSRTSFEQRLESARQAEAAKLPKKEREKYLAATSNMMGAAMDKAAMHEADESRATVVSSREAQISGAQEDALDSWDDDKLFEQALSEAAARQDELARLTGASPELAQRAREELISETVRNRAILIADKDPEAAEQYIENEDRLSATQKLELRETLAPLVQQHRVETMMSQFVVAGGGGGGDTVEGMIRGAESAGNPNAKNPRSSAEGLFQYIDETWLSSVRAAARSGAVDPAYANMSNSELLARKTDADLQTAVYRFDEQRYRSDLESVGAEATPQNIYMLHHFGRGGGTALMRALQENPGMSAAVLYKRNGWNWDGVVAANPGLSHGDTVADVHAYAGYHIGRGSNAAGQASVQFDFAAAYDYAQSIEDPALRKAFLAQVEAREATEAKRRSAAQGAAVESATERFFTTGDGELTLSEKLTLGLGGFNSFREMVSKAEQGTLVSDPSVYNLLNDMAASQSTTRLRDFAKPGSIEKYVDQLSREDYRSLVNRRSVIRGELEGQALTREQLEQNPEAAVPIKAEHTTRIGEHLDRTGVSTKNEEARAQAEYAMRRRLQEQMIEFYMREKREPNPSEVDDMLYAQTLPIAGPTNFAGFGTTIPLYEMDSLADDARLDVQVEYDNVPLEDRKQLATRLAAVLGRPPTEAEIVTAFETKTLMEGQITPSGFSDEIEAGVDGVPIEGYTYYGGTLGMPDEEIKALWEDYLRQVFIGAIDPEEEPFAPKSGSRKGIDFNRTGL